MRLKKHMAQPAEAMANERKCEKGLDSVHFWNRSGNNQRVSSSIRFKGFQKNS